jgi:hypothetical protein
MGRQTNWATNNELPVLMQESDSDDHQANSASYRQADVNDGQGTLTQQTA